jgi:hypothetical protein
MVPALVVPEGDGHEGAALQHDRGHSLSRTGVGRSQEGQAPSQGLQSQDGLGF